MKTSYSIQSLTISIPAYNDEQSLIKLVTECQDLCTSLSLPLQMLIVNDGSFDNTPEVAERLAQKYSNIRIIHHPQNLGFGDTLKEIFMVPQTEWVLFLPGDNQFPASNLLRFLEIKDDYDYILGYRKDRKDGFLRKKYADFYSWLVSRVSGYKVKDVNSIVFFRSSIFDRFKLNGNSAFVHTEFFLRVSEAGFRIGEVEILHKEREFGTSAGVKPMVVLNIFKELFQYIAVKT